MSFTTDIKRELTRSLPKDRCCRLSMLSRILTTSGELHADGFSFTSENETVASYILKLVDALFDRQMTLTGAVKDPKHGKGKLTFSLAGEGVSVCCGEIASCATETRCCAAAALKGAFLGSGSCSLPREGAAAGYHLEIVFPTSESAEEFVDLLDSLQLFGSIVARGDRSVVYCKSREGIGDFLSVLGANSALKTFEEVSALREENNRRNRVENCMAGNIDRAMTASAEQIRLFVAHKDKIPLLPPVLQETARARIEAPTLSLQELAGKLGISKGGLNHRLHRIAELLTDEDGEDGEE